MAGDPGERHHPAQVAHALAPYARSAGYAQGKTRSFQTYTGFMRSVGRRIMSTEPEEWEEFIDAIKANMRQHAGYFAWPTDRTVEEIGVVQSLYESLEKYGEIFFHTYRSRGENNDPPDCEALTDEGERIALEVTELVDGESVAATKRKDDLPWELWTHSEAYELIQARIRKKDSPLVVKGGPYSQYVLIIYCDEPRMLDYDLIEHIRTCEFGPTKLLDRVFFLMSYSPWEKSCPFVELMLSRV